MTDFTARLRNLSDSQRQQLVARLSAMPRKNTYCQLVAFVQARKEFNEDSLREHLAANLPDYMLPGRYVALDALPLTANGKVDRSALVLPRVKKDQTDELSPLEKTLTAIWCDVLDMEIIHSDDNYFELGGDSITSLQMISRASKSGIVFTPADLMENPSIRELAHRITLNQTSAEEHGNEKLSDSTQDIPDMQDADEILRVLDLD